AAGGTQGGWSQISASLSGSSVRSFSGPANVTVTYSFTYGFALHFEPQVCGGFYAYLNLVVNGTSYTSQCYYTYPAFPWYFPKGVNLTLKPTGYGPTYWNYWNGSGPGNFTGTGAWANITMN